ncbi:isoprenylcysteine carboxylmethyltransferase family protein [Bradyrhizobium ontarionense]|uniref:Isoprenylcysteine carboxylmethyltransferase family protein n=1 Tax=Bradyrhizobium ontarionense TaxID=2898149 RepID=A0ABY3RB64_9BRAD|nr:isoprenylcysteine carboxylmethyltransferase family protein [Bradyrhizobium sp. A19]UFZ04272.1 isoprenylcysteine carboxylmethyltransferase family protein [Bradyrhizobium sp. A19]
MNRLDAKTLASLSALLAVMAAIIFAAAGTFYWQAWLFLLVYSGASLVGTIDLMRRDRALLRRRLKGGPFAEREPVQRLIMTIISVAYLGLLLVPAFDHRFGWSRMPPLLVVGGDLLVVLGFAGILRVFRENSFSAATVEVASDQTVIATGPYAILRHPMYAAAVVLMAGIPIALGSWWGLFVMAAIVPALVWRLLHEERMLAEQLPGYRDYLARVRWRLVPSVW